MDVYRPPESKLLDGASRPFSPILGLLIGLFYTIVLTTIVSTLLTVVFLR